MASTDLNYTNDSQLPAQKPLIRMNLRKRRMIGEQLKEQAYLINTLD